MKITRDGDTAIIEYADPKVATTHFTMKAGELAQMTDAELLDYCAGFARRDRPFRRDVIAAGSARFAVM